MVQVRSSDYSYVGQFESLQSSEDDQAPAWLKSLRREAFREFETLGFPTTRNEDWKYTNVAPIARQKFALAGRTGAETASSLVPDFPGLNFYGGLCVGRAPSGEGLPDSIRVMSLASALRDSPELIEPHLNRQSAERPNGFVALNNAFLRDGGFVHVPAGAATPSPIVLSFAADSGPTPSMANPYNLIVLGEGARATVIEQYGGGDGVYLTNAVTEIVIGPGARLDYFKVQAEGTRAYHVGTTNATLARNSEFSSFSLDIGARIGRNDLSVRLDGEGAACEMNGLYIASENHHVDNHTSVDHRSSFTPSRQLYKGVLAGSARGVFNGKVIARRGTHQVDAQQANNNLLISDKAMIDTKPQLEIFADDLKCSHGATVGQLDAEQIFYLASRGIGPGQAKRILTYGFATSIVAKVADSRIRDHLMTLVDGEFSKFAESGAFEEAR